MQSVDGACITQAEIRDLVTGLTDLSAVAPSTLVPFVAHRLRHARAVWINERWFLEKGLDVSEPETYQRVSAWLVDEFGFSVRGDTDPASMFHDNEKIFYADRYGSTEGTSPHGGSGRVGISGYFQVKGIGVTPLVGVGAHRDHSHGCMFLEEGIREAIYSEIAAAEFPHGAVPIVAILDVGYSLEDKAAQRRALAVRPAVMRAAHAERAPLFLRSVKHFKVSQADDVKRVREVARTWSRGFNGESLASIAPLKEFLSRVAAQIAFSNIQRFFCGGYFSSNLSVSGEILDFGNVHVLPNWSKAEVIGGTVSFGSEIELFKRIVRSILFSFQKYALIYDSRSFLSACEELQFYAADQYKEFFKRECLKLFNVHRSDDFSVIYEIVKDYFDTQQKRRFLYSHGKIIRGYQQVDKSSWMLDRIKEAYGENRRGSGSDFACDLYNQLVKHFALEEDPELAVQISWMTAIRLLSPRSECDRGFLMSRIESMLAQSSPLNRIELKKFVCDAVGGSRRVWPRLPNNLGVLSQVVHERTSALLCVRYPDGKAILWLEGYRISNKCVCFESALSCEELFEAGGSVDGMYWTAMADANLFEGTRAREVRLGKSTFLLPPMQIYYPVD